CPYPRLTRGLREDRGGVNQTARVDGVAEVGSANTRHRGTDVAEVQQVAGDDLGTEVGQASRSVVVPVHQRPNPRTAFTEQLHGVGAGLTGGTGDEVQLVGGHARAPGTLLTPGVWWALTHPTVKSATSRHPESITRE